MIQQLLEGLFDDIGIDRAVIKKQRIVKKCYSDFIQTSLFDLIITIIESKCSKLHQYWCLLRDSYKRVIPFKVCMQMREIDKVISSFQSEINYFKGFIYV